MLSGNVKIHNQEPVIFTSVACFFSENSECYEKQLLILFTFFNYDVYSLKQVNIF